MPTFSKRTMSDHNRMAPCGHRYWPLFSLRKLLYPRMILTCPSCATRYQADEAKFPAAGRQVRCAKCGHVWHQPGPTPEESAEAEPQIFAFPPETAPAPERSSAPDPEPEP